MIIFKHDIKAKACLRIISLFFYVGAYAQQSFSYTFRHITQQDGLLHNQVLDIQQDKRGFIWIVTSNGLQRYDGSRFVNFKEMLNDPYEKLNNGARLFSDEKNNWLWIYKENKLEKLELSGYRFSVYSAEQAAQIITAAKDSFTDGNNRRWFTGQNIIFREDSSGGKFSYFIFNINPAKNHQSNFFIRDNRNLLWLVNFTNGLLLFDDKTKKLYSVDYNPLNNDMLKAFNPFFSKGRISARNIMQDARHNFWITTWTDVFYRYNTDSKKIYTYSLRNVLHLQADQKNSSLPYSVSSIYEDNHGAIWISTEYAGLIKYDGSKDEFERIPINEKDKQDSRFSYQIFSIFQDRDENIWLATDNGITIFNPYRQYFKAIRHEENNKRSLPRSEINCFIQTVSGDILTGTWGAGIAVYDSNWNFKKNIQFKKPIEHNYIWAFVQNDDGNIWAGCQHGYIHIYNPKTEFLQTIHPPELNGYTIRCMIKDYSGNIWMGLNDGSIAVWNKQEKKFYDYTAVAGNEEKNRFPILNLFIDRTGQCWAGTEAGLKKFDISRKLFTATYLPDSNKAGSISAKPIEGIEQVNDSTLAIATVYGGLNFLNLHSNRFSCLSQPGIIPSNIIHSVKKDAAGYLWFTTDYELYKFKPPGNQVIQYNTEPGIINSAFKLSGFYPLRDGRWVTSSRTELICFDPEKNDMYNNSPVKVEIAGFKVFDNPVFIDSLIAANRPVYLDYRQNFLTIEFTALQFSHFRQIKYYYRLRDVNADWVYAGAKNFTSYTNLEPGKYIFEVKTSDSSAITSFVIIIAPPFWKTWWFRSLVTVLAILLIYFIVKKRINAIKHEAEMRQQMSEAEMKALRAQMNPHFIFNCLNSIDNLIQSNEKEKATLYLSKFARLIRSVLEISKNNVVPCWKDMETLQLYLELEELRWDKKITYQVNIADEILQGDYKVPPLVIQPFVENAIYHGLLNKIDADRWLRIDVTVNNSYVHYSIEDNGVGRQQAAVYRQLNKPVHESMGMQITTDRINLFNQTETGAVKITDLTNENGQPAGTRVEVNLINQL
jgi:ligand-binding sensor domain-containing protein